MKRFVFMFFLLPTITYAQVYKCLENGRTIYAERPCSKTAQALNINSSVTEEQRQQAIDSARRQKQLSNENDYDAAVDRLARTKQAAAQNAADSAKKRRCDNLLRKAKDAKDESHKWRYHQGLIDDAKRRQKEAEDAHFSECYGQ